MKALAATLLLTAAVAACASTRAAELDARLGERQVNVAVRSLLEIRDHALVRQGWDISCGAAALSTILTHTYGAHHSELSIAVSILANADPAVVRARGGFSLLDLKRFAEAVGFEARGYGGLSVDDLASSPEPAILPVRIRGLDHFVVFRGRTANRVRIGDPAFGNLVISERRFARMWQSGIGMFVAQPGTSSAAAQRLPEALLDLGIADLGYAYRLSRGPGNLPSGRP